MKKYKLDPKSNLFDIVIPTGEGADDDGFFDDCPLCQQLRKESEKGNFEEVVIQWEEEDAN
jgi:hypothetical protein